MRSHCPAADFEGGPTRLSRAGDGRSSRIAPAYHRIAEAAKALRQRQGLEWFVAFAEGERIERGRDPENYAYRAAGDLRRHRSARGTRLVHAGHGAPPALRVGRPGGEQKPHRPAGLLRELRNPGELSCLILEIAVHPEGAGTRSTQTRADAGQLVDLGEAARHHLALRRFVR